MVSFGHAAYLGIGGYAVGILADAGIVSGWVQWSVAVAVSALAALVIGALCLPRRQFHHDHPGIRADDLLRGLRARPIWGRRRAHHFHAQPVFFDKSD